MALSSDLISQFVKQTNDKPVEKKESKVYATVVKSDGRTYAKFDGSDLLTPISTTADIEENERVVVTIKDHNATITGNLSSPAARSATVDEQGNKIIQLDNNITQINNTINTQNSRIETIDSTVSTQNSKIETIRSEVETIGSDISTQNSKISTVESEIKTVKSDISTQSSKIKTIESDIETMGSDISTQNSKIETIGSTVTTLKSDIEVYNSSFKIENDVITGIKGMNTEWITTEDLEADHAKIGSLDSDYANIEFTNIGKAAMQYFYAQSGLIQNVVVGDQTITGELVGVTIKGDLIEGNTIKAEKLVVKGEDGLYYKLNVDSLGETTASADEKYQNGLDGSVIIAQSITATKIAVDDLVAFDATIGGFQITENSLYSGVKASVDNTTRGIYLDNTGQIAIGDSSNYIKYYKDTDGTYKLAVAAKSIVFGASAKNVEDALTDVNDAIAETNNTINNLEIGGRNYIINSAEPVTLVGSGLDTRVTNSKIYCSSLDIAESLDGKEMTVSFDLENNVTEGFCRLARAVSYNKICDFSAELNTENKRYSFTFTITDVDHANTSLMYLQGSFVGSVTLRNIKLEIGNKATDWSPAPEDTTTEINNINNAVNSIEVGGGNLLKNSRTFSTLTQTTSNEWKVVAADDYNTLTINTETAGWVECRVPLYTSYNELTGDVTVSFEFYESIEDLLVIALGVYDSSGSRLSEGTNISVSASFTITDISDNWKRATYIYSSQYIAQRNNIEGGAEYRLQFKKRSGKTGEIRIRKPKMEKGNKATDWSPAPEDTITDINNAVDAIDIGGRNLILKSDFSELSSVPDIWSVEKDMAIAYSTAVGVTSSDAVSIELSVSDYISNCTNQNALLSIEYFVEEAIAYGTTSPWVGAQLSFYSGNTVIKGYDWYGNKRFPTTVSTDWNSFSRTVSTTGLENITRACVRFYFRDATGKVKFRHPKLEMGNKATDWTPAPEDVDEDIQTAQNSGDKAQSGLEEANNRLNEAELRIDAIEGQIVLTTTDEDGTTSLIQNGSGWTFNLDGLATQVSDTREAVGTLEDDLAIESEKVKTMGETVDELSDLPGHIYVGTTDDGDPCIEICQDSTQTKVQITDDAINFVAGSSIPAYIVNDETEGSKLKIEHAEVTDELAFGGFSWKVRSNGNMGLIWKG